MLVKCPSASYDDDMGRGRAKILLPPTVPPLVVLATDETVTSLENGKLIRYRVRTIERDIHYRYTDKPTPYYVSQSLRRQIQEDMNLI